MKLEMHPDHVKNSIDLGLDTTDNMYWHLEIFNGGPPNEADFEDYFLTTDHTQVYQVGITQAVAEVAQDLGEGVPKRLLHFSTLTKPVYTDTDTFEFKLSRSSEKFDFFSQGVASWFLLYGTPSSSYNGSYEITTPVFIGTIGLVGSSSDLEIRDVSITENKEFKANDIKVQLKINLSQ
jgi:hypothetical protein